MRCEGTLDFVYKPVWQKNAARVLCTHTVMYRFPKNVHVHGMTITLQLGLHLCGSQNKNAFSFIDLALQLCAKRILYEIYYEPLHKNSLK